MNSRVSTDIIIQNEKGILLIKRGIEPYKGMWALPGGFVEYNEDPRDTSKREAKEETNLDIELIEDRVVHVFGDPGRDPRHHTIALAFKAKAHGEPKAGDDAADIKYFKKDEIPEKMAFDHKEIIKVVLGW